MINLDEIKPLVEEGRDQVLSLYLQVDNALRENQAQTPAWRIHAKNALREIDEQVAGDPERRKQWNAIRAYAEDQLDGYQEEGRGLVMFIEPDEAHIYSLPVMPTENMHQFGKALVAPLLWMLDEYEPYLIVLVDSEQAHFYSMYLGGMAHESAMASDRFTYDFREKTIMPRTMSPRAQMSGTQVQHGSHRDIFQDTMDDWIFRFHRDVAQQVAAERREMNAERVIIGGMEKAAHAVYEELHESIKQHVVAVTAVPFEDNDPKIMERLLPLALEHERKQENEIVNQVIDFAKSGGRGALGWHDVREALDQQRVELLVAPWPSDEEEQLRQFTVDAMRNNSRIELVHGEAADRLRENGGIGARLYYAI
jgi:hypothetical protein